MSFTELIPEQARVEIETAARAAGLSVEDFCARAAGARRLPSVEAAREQIRLQKMHKTGVFMTLDRSEKGLSDMEVAAELGVSEQTVRRCRVELVNDGLVEDSGERLHTAQSGFVKVWRLTERGKRALA